MEKHALLICFFASISIFTQNSVKGIIRNSSTNKPLQQVKIGIQNVSLETISNVNGVFLLQNIPNGNQLVEVKLDGFETQYFSLDFFGQSIDLEIIFLFEDFVENRDLSFITLTDEELSEDGNSADIIAGLLQASKDTYLQTVAFEFSSSFFKIRGLDSENATVLINGIEMNKLYDGKPQWSNWGGLNDATRNQEFTSNLSASEYTFGGFLGTTNLNTRASQQNSGIKISYASSNRSYSHRIMATYASGLLATNWAYSFSASRRSGNEGFNDGTLYEGNSFFASIDKIINQHHLLSFSMIYTPNKRGKSSPNTQEVYDLKGIKYNEYWGYQNENKRNSRIKEVEEPIFMMNHDWEINKRSSLNTNVSYQFGKTGNSRIDYNFGANPSGTYYQKLPSYHVSRGNLDEAYLAEQEFLDNGQIDWLRLYDANSSNSMNQIGAAYIISQERNDENTFNINTVFSSKITNQIRINSTLAYKKSSSENYALVEDLLGGNGYLDFDRFGNSADEQQNDLRNPNRIAQVGDRFKYNYQVNSSVLTSFAQAQFAYRKIDFFLSGTISNTAHQRDGLYENGSFPDVESFGKSNKSTFTNYGLKSGATYKISGRKFVDFNIGYRTKSPNIKNTFANSRENNKITSNLKSETIFLTDFSYLIRNPIITSKITGYYAKIKDAAEISFYYANGISEIGGDGNAFVQEILTGIDKTYFGLEFGIKAQVSSAINLKAAANLGQYIYTNNPNLQLTSDLFEDLNLTSNLKNYKLANGPQRAYSLGFEYRDPDFWWFGATANFFNDIYVDIAPLTRTENFYLDADGLPFNDYNETIAKELLRQEAFSEYLTINLVGGKSWKIGDYYMGLFASVNNLLGEEYKTGGFEQARNSNYKTLLEDKSREKPIFGPKYWYGRGTTYFLNIYLKI